MANRLQHLPQILLIFSTEVSSVDSFEFKTSPHVLSSISKRFLMTLIKAPLGLRLDGVGRTLTSELPRVPPTLR